MLYLKLVYLCLSRIKVLAFNELNSLLFKIEGFFDIHAGIHLKSRQIKKPNKVKNKKQTTSKNCLTSIRFSYMKLAPTRPKSTISATIK